MPKHPPNVPGAVPTPNRRLHRRKARLEERTQNRRECGPHDATPAAGDLEWPQRSRRVSPNSLGDPHQQ
eukprot:2976346-Alexandrium_andersonii.AAC.1